MEKGQRMKAYFKILLSTMAIQTGGFIVSIFADKTINGDIDGNIWMAGTAIGLLLSMIVSVILAFRWAKTLKGKLACIFLMPTNYILPLLWLAYLWVLNTSLDILDGLRYMG